MVHLLPFLSLQTIKGRPHTVILYFPSVPLVYCGIYRAHTCIHVSCYRAAHMWVAQHSVAPVVQPAAPGLGGHHLAAAGRRVRRHLHRTLPRTAGVQIYEAVVLTHLSGRQATKVRVLCMTYRQKAHVLVQ